MENKKGLTQRRKEELMKPAKHANGREKVRHPVFNSFLLSSFVIPFAFTRVFCGHLIAFLCELCAFA
jgi:hypothetical protein